MGGVLRGVLYVPLRICLRWSYKVVPILRGEQVTETWAQELGCKSRCMPLNAHPQSSCQQGGRHAHADVKVCRTLWGPGETDVGMKLPCSPARVRLHLFIPRYPTNHFMALQPARKMLPSIFFQFWPCLTLSLCFGQYFMGFLFGVQTSLWNFKAHFGLSQVAGSLLVGMREQILPVSSVFRSLCEENFSGVQAACAASN